MYYNALKKTQICMMAAILDLGMFGWSFFLLWHIRNELISDEKALLTFMSNLSRSLLGLHGITRRRTWVYASASKTKQGKGVCLQAEPW